ADLGDFFEQADRVISNELAHEAEDDPDFVQLSGYGLSAGGKMEKAQGSRTGSDLPDKAASGKQITHDGNCQGLRYSGVTRLLASGLFSNCSFSAFHTRRLSVRNAMLPKWAYSAAR